MASLIVAGDAVASEVATGKKFCAGVLYNETGTGGGGSAFLTLNDGLTASVAISPDITAYAYTTT